MSANIEALIERRKQCGLSRNKLAQMMGYSKNWLYSIEHDHEKRFSQTFVDKYRDCLERYEALLKN